MSFYSKTKYTSLLITLFTISPLLAKEVSIIIGGKSLKGELNIAEGNRSKVAFILSGSGPTDKDGNTVGVPGKNNSLLYLSDFLNKEGISTLRVDKRGVGASVAAGLEESDLRFTTYVEDARHWIGFLEQQGFSDLVLIGHSEGALVASLAAPAKPVTGLVCIAGAGRSAGVVLREQLKPKIPQDLYAQADKTISSLENGNPVDDFPESLAALFRPSVQPYLISWFAIDPVKAVSDVKVPMLIVQGTTDLQVSVRNAELLHAGAKGSELLVIKGMNHILKEVDGDLNAQLPSYMDPQLGLHKDLGPGVLKFIKK